VRFIAELAALVALGYWGWETGSSGVVRIAAAVGLPLVAAVVWGLFVAPQASHRLSDPLRLLIELVIFAAAVGALAAVGRWEIAVVYALIVTANLVLMFVWNQR
jgi:hypothetical protein